MYFYFYQVLMILSLIISIYLLTQVVPRRHLPAAPAMIAMVAAVFIWTLGFLFESNSNTLEHQLLFTKIGYLGLMAVPPAWFVFANNYTNSLKFMRGGKLVLICIIPFIITILIWTNDWHNLIWSNLQLTTSGAFTITTKEYGPFFWVAFVHNYLLIILGSIILLRRLFVGTPLYTKQALSLVIAVLLPLVWNVIYVFDLIEGPHKDLTPAMFAFSGIALVLGLSRFHLFTTVPFAREFIIQQMKDSVFIFDTRQYLVEANPAAIKISGLDKRIIGKKIDELVLLSPLFANFTGVDGSCEEINIDVSGEKHIFKLEIIPMILSQKQPAGRLIILHDITDWRRSEEQYRLIAEHSADIIYKLNIKEGRYSYVSPSVERILGYTEKEALSLSVRDMITPESYEKQQNAMITDIQNSVFYTTLELDAIHKDGHTVPIELNAKFICDEKGMPVEVVGVARDITQRKKMEKQLIMQDRLASIGQLTSGVAHELNNPLTAIINFSTLLMKRDLPEDLRQDVAAINEEAQRTANIVKTLLIFARKQKQEKELVNIIETIQKVLALRAYEYKVNNIHVNVHAEPDLPSILGNSPQLQQVFFNIIINAEYFMLQAHKQGKLTITAERKGDMVRITFKDDGPGIPQENMKNIFSPFFTTKEAGKGTGLSLSICLSIINEHGGRIWAESEPGEGASFIVELPVFNESTPEDGVIKE